MCFGAFVSCSSGSSDMNHFPRVQTIAIDQKETDCGKLKARRDRWSVITNAPINQTASASPSNVPLARRTGFKIFPTGRIHPGFLTATSAIGPPAERGAVSPRAPACARECLRHRVAASAQSILISESAVCGPVLRWSSTQRRERNVTARAGVAVPAYCQSWINPKFHNILGIPFNEVPNHSTTPSRT